MFNNQPANQHASERDWNGPEALKHHYSGEKRDHGWHDLPERCALETGHEKSDGTCCGNDYTNSGQRPVKGRNPAGTVRIENIVTTVGQQ